MKNLFQVCFENKAGSLTQKALFQFIDAREGELKAKSQKLSVLESS
ncbi:MAG: hypothetical protein ACOY3K_08555 [Candidatus Omnitrophota bacterium]